MLPAPVVVCLGVRAQVRGITWPVALRLPASFPPRPSPPRISGHAQCGATIWRLRVGSARTRHSAARTHALCLLVSAP